MRPVFQHGLIRRRLLRASGVSVLLVGMAAYPAAQEQPDFSGRWVLVSEPPATDTPRALSVAQTVARTNRRGDPVPPYYKDITITRDFQNGARSETHEIGISGGSVSGIPAPGLVGARTVFRTVWEGRDLVFESSSHPVSPEESVQWTERREAWVLDGEGRLVVTIATRSSTERPTRVTLLYRRARTEVPSDFAVRFEFGTCTTDVLDTFNGVFVRDMGPQVPAVSVPLVLSSEVVEAIHGAVINAMFFGYPSEFNDSGPVRVLPANHYRLAVRRSGSTHSVSWVDDTLPRSDEATRLRFLFTRIQQLVADRPELKSLPEAPVLCM